MVVWKGEVERQHGEKAYNLDQVSLEVPNFFVVTSEEVKDLFQTRNPERIRDSSLELNGIRDAYKEVGMTSEVRKASSRARNLVGGQRDNSKVAIRVSDESFSDFELDVGSSGLEEAIKSVVASYFENNDGREFPNIIVQKMIEAEYTGALVKGEKDYIEAVEGLGIPLEEGTTRPTRYLIGDDVEVLRPEIQRKVTRNPMTGDYRNKRVREPDRPFSRSEIEEFAEKASNSVKFVYKRGSFFVVDAFNPQSEIQDIEEIKVSPGEMNGTIGEEISFSEETVPPQQYETGLVAKKGGYTSTDAEKARKAGKPAIFSSDREEGEKIGEKTQTNSSNSQKLNTISATKIETISDLERDYSREQAYLENFSGVFAFDGHEAILDARIMPREGLESALDYIQGDITVLLDEVDEDVLYSIVKNDFSVGVSSARLAELESALERAERRFMLDKLRELD